MFTGKVHLPSSCTHSVTQLSSDTTTATQLSSWSQTDPVLIQHLTALSVPPASLEKEAEELRTINTQIILWIKAFVSGCHAENNQKSGGDKRPLVTLVNTNKPPPPPLLPPPVLWYNWATCATCYRLFLSVLSKHILKDVCKEAAFTAANVKYRMYRFKWATTLGIILWSLIYREAVF